MPQNTDTQTQIVAKQQWFGTRITRQGAYAHRDKEDISLMGLIGLSLRTPLQRALKIPE